MTYRSFAALLLLALLAFWASLHGPDMSAAQPGSGRGGGGGSGGGQSADGQAGDGGVRKFGAVGDGETDDTAAIQAAVDSRVGEVKFPAGVYRITRPIVIDLDRLGFVSLSGRGTARIVMAGAGPAFKFVGTHDGTADPDTVKPNVWSRQRMPLVDGIEIVGDHQAAEGIVAIGCMQLTITRTNIRECLHAIHLQQRDRNVLIAECHLYHNRGVGVFLDDVNLHQINIANCHISYNAGGGVVSRGGNVRNIQIGTCDIEANMAPDGPPTANVLLDCTGGSVAEVAITGCTIQHSHDAPDSANVRMIGASILTRGGTTGPVNWGHLTIANNVMSDVQTNIDLRGVRDVTIVGNTLWRGYSHNLRIEDSSHVVLGANVLGRNPPYNYGGSTNNSVVFRNCRDCTVSGLHLFNARVRPAGMILENCRRFNVTGCTLLDCDNAGLLLRSVFDSRVSDCLIRDDRQGLPESVSLRVIGGGGNMIVDNLLAGQSDIAAGRAHTAGNYDGK